MATEEYLKEVREEAKKLKLPLQEEMGSPCCENAKIKLSVETFNHAVKDKGLYHGQFYVYTCDKCGERFTTGESDTLSLASLKQKKK